MTQNSFLYANTLLRRTAPQLRLHAGEDFSLWQKKAYDKLWELLGLDFFTRCDPDFTAEWEKDRDDFHELRFTFQSEEGYRIPCHLLLPHGNGPFVPVICLQGHSTGMHNSLGRMLPTDTADPADGDRNFAIRAVQEGCAAIVMEQRYMGECSSYEAGKPSCDLQAQTALLLGRCAIGERVWDVMRLTDLLEARFSAVLQMDRLVCLGNSGGGTATFYAACIEKRIRTAIPSCSVCTYKDSIGPIRHCTCNYVPGIARWFDMGDLAGLIAPRQFLLTAGAEDPIFPLAGVKESFALAQNAYRAAGCENLCRLIVGEEGHRFYADPVWKTYHELNP